MQTPTLQRIELLSDGFLKKYLMHYQMPDGREFTYDAVSRKEPEDFERELRRTSDTPPRVDAVSIIATTDRDEMLLVKEFRYPLNSWCIGCPAGLLEDGEAVESAVDRELREETGYAVKRTADGRLMLEVLPQPGYTSNGMSEECLAVVRAQVERVGEPHTEPNELIEILLLPIADIPRFLEENEVPIGSRAQLALEAYGPRLGPNASFPTPSS